MATSLQDLVDAVKNGTGIDLEIIDLSGGQNPRARSDAYLRAMKAITQFRLIERLAYNICRMLKDVEAIDKAVSLRNWLNSASEPIDTAINRLEQDLGDASADALEQRMAAIADAFNPIIEHTRNAVLEITDRHRAAISAVDFSDLLIPVPSSEGTSA